MRRDTTSPSSNSPLLGIAHQTWATSCHTGDSKTERGWKFRHLSRLDSSMPRIFWAGAGHLWWPRPLLKKLLRLSYLWPPQIMEGSQFHRGSFSGRLSCGPIFFEPIFFVGFRVSHRARNQMLACSIYFWRTTRTSWSTCSCNDFCVVCHGNLLSLYLRRERSKQLTRCQVLNSN